MWRVQVDKKHPQLWHWQVEANGEYYKTACGRLLKVDGSISKVNVPAGACSKCLHVVMQPMLLEEAKV